MLSEKFPEMLLVGWFCIHELWYCVISWWIGPPGDVMALVRVGLQGLKPTKESPAQPRLMNGMVSMGYHPCPPMSIKA